MSTIREDVVTIGFEVEQNPFADLTSDLNSIDAKLGILEDTESGLKNIEKSAEDATDQMDSLANSIHAPPIDKLVDGVKKLGTGLAHPKKSFKSLADSAKQLAKEKLDAGIKKLPGPLQTAAKTGEKLLGSLGKVAKLSFKTAASGIKSIATNAAGAAASAGKFAVKGLAAGITAATVAAVGLGTAAVNVGAGFEASMSQVAATMGMTAGEADYSNEQYAMLANTAKEMGAATKFSAAESAEALNYMALAGYDAEKACGALPTVLNLASAGGMDLAAASDMVTDSMSALGIEATQENLTKFGDQLAKTAQKSNTSVSQLGEAVLTVGGTAKTLAGGTTELNTLLGIIADNGVKGAEGGTALRNIMLSLQAPTDMAAKKMKALGLSVYTAEGKMRPMNDILNDLNKSMDGMSDQKKQDALSTIFNKNDLKSVNALLANSGDRYNELSGYVEDSAGAMENMAKTMNDNLTGRITEFKSATEGTGIAIYEALGSSNLKDAVAKASGWMTQLTKATEKGGLSGLVEEVGTVASEVAVTVADQLPSLVQGGVSIVQSLVSGIDQNRGSIAQSVMLGLSTMLTGIMKLAPQLLSLGAGMLLSLLQGLDQQMPGILSAGLTAVDNLCAGLIANGPAIIQSGINIILQLLNGLISAAPTILTTGIQLVIMLIQGLIGAIPQLIQAVPQLISAIVTTIMSVNWLQLGIDIVKGIGSGIIDGVKGLFGKGKDAGKEVSDGIDSSTPLVTASTTNQMTQMSTAADAGFSTMIQNAGQFSTDFTGKIDETNLYASGENIMLGLNNGMLAMRPTVIGTAEGIAADVKNAVNGSLDIHSPSRVMEDSGQFTDLGLVKGMRNYSGKVDQTAQEIGDSAASRMSPIRSRYSPDSSSVTNNQSTSNVSTYSPSFNLTLNGASASDSNERKVKRWVREAIREAMDGMGRTNPELREV